MALKILVSDPDKDWREKAKDFLDAENFQLEAALSGKEVQLKVYREKFYALILDMSTINHSALEVLKYVRLTSPSVKIIITLENNKVLEDMEMEREDVLRLGVSSVIVKPYSKEQLLEAVNGSLEHKLWKNRMANANQNHPPEEIVARDEEFTRIKIAEASIGNPAIFNLYIRLSENHYVKIIHAGDFFDQEKIKKYKTERQIDHLFFKTKDRALYVHFVNDLLEKVLKKGGKVPQETKVNLVKNLTEKFVEEVYTQGLKPQLIDEGNRVCKNITDLIRTERGLNKILLEFKNYDYSAYSHSFLVAFFSAALCTDLEWASSGTSEKVAMGSILHDIGKLKLPFYCSSLDPEQMTPEQLKDYKTHPRLGLEMISNYTVINQAVTQIVFQHHELQDGSGFPDGLTGMKIYPLAQVVGLVDAFAKRIVKKKLSPREGLRDFLLDREAISKYNQKYVKALVNSFMDSKVFL
ncbi:MAG: hypothetical protein A2504_14315 [Bdellovibrionales bacterium RIFOXYD12_FULL_39_22]|nr:MAG: hypothetical protein A2385_04750 [Bdellovibrionales bacterium RIFOXYB1_FULL_39_21]OFZ43457.1 MAG: hypothetical protein A2485_13265 [Bdellovibrionales bacterium RIFOXYC12_FULL_39_17]OFZ47000.1 MAG: hypothetical protein A2404_00325 [Bdellovibrionales bacterium RIFOXYC1_FULL_39_130]OFZ71364.1 MAG: hypothetical protein A2451_16290 [Bdellovibrionales bacterium RIFOXYC2_FULL_39_8]OFZ76197.1 MAG: hypothetical protein A2560_07575 [Bdellovibrionales bacterium RIFOXYD1_FULL_39_84]OFZ94432.1 MAG: